MNEEAALAGVHRELRDEFAAYFLRVVLLAVGVVVVLTLWRAHGAGMLGTQLAFSSLYALLLACYFARRAIPPWLQLAFCVLVAWTTGMTVHAVFGLFGNGAAYLMAAAGIGAALFGRGAGWGLVVSAVLALAAPAALWCLGREPAPYDLHAYFADPRSWITSITTYAGIATILILGTGRVMRLLLASEAEETTLAARLRAELAELESAERALDAEERRFAAAFARSPDAMAVWDAPDGAVREANDALVALAGGTRAQVLGIPVAELWERIGAPPALAAAAARLSQAPVRGLAAAAGSAGRPRRQLVCDASEFTADGERLAIAVLRDVTPQREQEAALERFGAELETAVAERTAALDEATRELEALAYSVAHHLRAPLRAMNAYAGLLASERAAAIGPEGVAHAARARDAALAMGRRVDALLELSRINRRELHRETLDLSAIATTALARLQAEDPRPDTEVRIAPGLVALADRALAGLLVAELLSNAWRHAARAARPLVEVGVSARPEGRAFYVRDNGAGFDTARAARLFDPFESSSRADGPEGPRIGLATAARAAQRHGGRVWAESSPGRGTTFWFTLS